MKEWHGATDDFLPVQHDRNLSQRLIYGRRAKITPVGSSSRGTSFPILSLSCSWTGEIDASQ